MSYAAHREGDMLGIKNQGGEEVMEVRGGGGKIIIGRGAADSL